MSRERVFRVPLSLAIALNATTPDPGGPGVEIWSTTTNSKLLWNGSNWVDAVGSGGGGGGGVALAVALAASSLRI